MRYIRPYGSAANLSWETESPLAPSVGASTNFSWYTDPIVRFFFNEAITTNPPITFLFKNEVLDFSTSVDLVFSGEPYTTSPINLVFGEYGDSVVLGIQGSGSVVVSVASETFGELSPVASSDITVSVGTATSGVVFVTGAGGVPVSVTTTGAGQITSVVDIIGSSSVTVDVTSASTGTKEIYGNGSATVSVTVTGTGTKESFVYSETPVSVTTQATGAFSGGPEIFGSGDVDVVILVTGGAAVLNTIFAASATPVAITVLGVGTSALIFDDIHGVSFVSISVETGIEGDMVSDDRPLRIPQIESNKDSITYSIEIAVDLDKREYEVWKIESNKSYLEVIKRNKLKTTFELGTEIKDSFTLVEEPSEFYNTSRSVVVRRYGVSTIELQINIDKGYRFIKNEVNIKRLVEREVDRAILDTYALYELEFE